MEALKVNVGHPKTRKTQTAAYRLQKLEASQKLKEHLQHERKKKAGAKGKTVVSNTKPAKVRNLEKGGPVKRPFRGKKVAGTAVARGCGAIMANRRKRTKGAVTQS